MKKILAFLLNITLLVLLENCDVLDKYPLDKPSQETFWTSASEINSGVVACYRFLQETRHNTYPFPIVLDLMADTGFPRQDSDFKTIATGQHDSSTELIRSVWHSSYQGVGRANLMLKVIEEKSSLLTDTEYRQFKGELLFLRGYYYTHLITYFGNVPLILKPIETESEVASFLRENKEVVLEQIFKDFTDATSLLENKYVTKGDIGRATKGAAEAYKARAALYFGKWNIAATAAQAVITSKTYSLYPSYGNLFLPVGLNDPLNEEIILKQEYSSLIPDYHQLPLYMQTRNLIGYACFAPSQNLIDSYHCTDGKNTLASSVFDKNKPFENRDPRLRLSFVVPGDRFGAFQFESHIDSTTCWNYETKTKVLNLDCYANSPYTSYTGYYPRKYNDASYYDKNTKGDYPIILCRYAEVLLTYAEAKIEMNEIDESVVNALNQIRRDRNDVKMPTFSISDFKDQMNARKIVRHERKIELAFEGFRYTDIRRWQGFSKYANRPIMGRPFKGEYLDWPEVTFDENDEPVYNYENYVPHPSKDYRIVENRSFVTNKHELWPIPQRELNVSQQLTQNPGY